MKESMTSRERWVSAIHMEPVDRLPFWPKLGGSAYVEAQRDAFRQMDCDEVHDWIGSDKHWDLSDCIKETRTRTSVTETREDGLIRTVYETPHGQLESLLRHDSGSDSWAPIKAPVSTLADVKLMTEIYEDIEVDVDRNEAGGIHAVAEKMGEQAVRVTSIGESPLMHFVEWLTDIKAAHYLLADHRGEVEALFAAMDSVLMKRTEIAAEYVPADLFYFVENTSTTLISPEQYRTYCVGHISRYARVLRDAGRAVALHMCGHLKDILPDLAKLPVQAFEAFTSPTVGNTSLLDGRTACPDKCLIGGTNATLWTKTAAEIIAQIEKDLNELPHHRGIVVTSAGVMPPIASPETIREVCRRVRQYKARM